jgi:hypothetical protein
MHKKQRKKQKGLFILLSFCLILWLAFPCFAAEVKPEKGSNSKQTDVFKMEPTAFRLTSQPVFTLTIKTLDTPNPLFSSFQKKEKSSLQIPKESPNKSKRTENALFTASLLTLTALNMADYVSTIKALQLPGLEEGNPIMRPFTKNILLFSTVKIGLTVLDYYLLKNIYKKNKTLGWVLSIAGNLAMSYVVSNNIRKIQSVTRK